MAERKTKVTAKRRTYNALYNRGLCTGKLNTRFLDKEEELDECPPQELLDLLEDEAE